MRAKSLRLVFVMWLAVVGVVATVAAVTAQSGPETPPGIAASDWVPLGDRCGLAVAGRAGGSVVRTQLWVKVGGGWERAIVEAPPKSVIPAR